MEKIVIDNNLRFAVKFLWENDGYNDKPGSVQFQVVTIQSYREGDNGPEDIEYNTGSGPYTQVLEEAYEKDPLCSGFIKWDGCMEIHDFNNHWCYHNTLAQDLVDMIYQQAPLIMIDNYNGYLLE